MKSVIFILKYLGERIPPQVDVYYEYIREGEILDLVCRVRVGIHEHI